MISTGTLQRFSLLAGLEPAFLEKLSSISEEKAVEKGEWLFHEGDNAEGLYLILQGGVDLKLKLDEKRNLYGTLTTLHEGNALGWSSLVEPYVYTLGAVATGQTRLIRINGEELRGLLKEQPEQGYIFMQRLAQAMATRVNLLSERAPGLSWRLVLSMLLNVLGIGTGILVLILGLSIVIGLIQGYSGTAQAIIFALLCAVVPAILLYLARTIYPAESGSISTGKNSGNSTPTPIDADRVNYRP
jgi:CRP/FNR family transcriptional regulator, cyclic AMP receptor protein